MLRSLSEKAPEQLQWLGVSYGLTQQLYNFWKRSQFEPVYLRQSPSDITGVCLNLKLRSTDKHLGNLLSCLADPTSLLMCHGSNR